MRRVGSGGHLLWLLLPLAACGPNDNRVGTPPPGTDGAPATPPARGTDSAPAPPQLDGSVPPGNATRCGDIMPEPGLIPFEAVKRLATTSSEVRILVYGQSNSEQPWWTLVRDWLKAQYPKSNLVMEEHARGGCSTQCLIGRDPWLIDHQTVNRVPDDVFAWKPDLIIFSAYGRHDDFDTLVKGFATGCSAFDDHPSPTAHCRAPALHPDYKPAEILLQTYWPDVDINDTRALPMLPPIPDDQYDRWMAQIWIPAVGKRYSAPVQPLWERWGAYLRANNLKVADLLPDGENLTDAGNKLMARMTESFLCYLAPR
jgi:hypothetical protein